MAAAPLFPYQHGYAREWRGWPAHMVPAERTLMFWYLMLPSQRVDEVWYDVPLDGEDARSALYPAAADILNPTELRTWYALNARRCDAIARAGDQYTIIELRSSADAQTIGEILIYQRLAEMQHPELQWTRPIVVARQYKSGVIATADAARVQHFTAPFQLFDPQYTPTRYVPPDQRQ